MKRLLSTLLLTGIAPVAGAHTLDVSGGLLMALGHELLGAHHLPLTILLIVIGVVLSRSWKKKTG
ncbi:MAG: hypothetical protein GTN98_09985 [Woeseiaceae bacterium]|nr:hypothetical protein [Woeseiaceae bacterium]